MLPCWNRKETSCRRCLDKAISAVLDQIEETLALSELEELNDALNYLR